MFKHDLKVVFFHFYMFGIKRFNTRSIYTYHVFEDAKVLKIALEQLLFLTPFIQHSKSILLRKVFSQSIVIIVVRFKLLSVNITCLWWSCSTSTKFHLLQPYFIYNLIYFFLSFTSFQFLFFFITSNWG